MILFSLLKSHTIISSPLSLFSFHKRFTHKNIKPPKLHIPPHTPTNPNLLSHPKAYSHNPNKVAVPNNPKNEASFKLDSYNHLMEYFKNQVADPNTNQTQARIEAITNLFGDSIIKKDDGVTTVMELLTLPESSNQIKQLINLQDGQDARHKGSLLLRLHNFSLTLVCIFFFYQKAPIQSPTIKFSLDNITHSLVSREVYLDLTKSKIINFNQNGEKIPPTHSMTINMITQFLISISKDLKVLLKPLLACYNNGESVSVFNYKNPPMSLLYKKYIIPDFTTAVPDYYYIFTLLANPDKITIFSDIQYKQWCTYKGELECLFHFMSICYNNSSIEKYNSFWEEFFIFFNKCTINQPFNKFMNEPISNNTFSRVINVLNIMTPRIWQMTSVLINSTFPLKK